jgi:hypothetical protein
MLRRVLKERLSMRTATGVFVLLGALAGAASAASPGIETAGLYAPMATVSGETLLWKAVKITCKCNGKTLQLEADNCPNAQKLICECKSIPPSVICEKARQ